MLGGLASLPIWCWTTPPDHPFLHCIDSRVATHHRYHSQAGTPRYAFSFRKLRFVHSTESGAFTKLKYPSHETVGAYLASSGLGSEAAVAAALERWGDNRFEVPVPSFVALLTDQLMAPFFCFQVFCVGLWALDEYWWVPGAPGGPMRGVAGRPWMGRVLVP